MSGLDRAGFVGLGASCLAERAVHGRDARRRARRGLASSPSRGRRPERRTRSRPRLAGVAASSATGGVASSLAVARRRSDGRRCCWVGTAPRRRERRRAVAARRPARGPTRRGRLLARRGHGGPVPHPSDRLRRRRGRTAAGCVPRFGRRSHRPRHAARRRPASSGRTPPAAPTRVCSPGCWTAPAHGRRAAVGARRGCLDPARTTRGRARGSRAHRAGSVVGRDPRPPADRVLPVPLGHLARRHRGGVPLAGGDRAPSRSASRCRPARSCGSGRLLEVR